MTITLGIQRASIQAQRYLGENAEAIPRIFERLSSGQRINHAADDPAGLSVAGSLSANRRIFSQAIRNANDGISLLTIADGALQELATITSRQRELAEQAANGTYSLVQRRSLDQEANALVDEFNRIVQATSFNGRTLFDTSNGSISIQLGRGADAVGVAVGAELGILTGLGTFGAAASVSTGTTPYALVTGDFNGDGKLDIITSNYGDNAIGVLTGNGDGTFAASTAYGTGTKPISLATGDVNGDGITDLIAGDYGSTTLSVLIGNGNGSFKARTIVNTVANPEGLELVDLNGDGKLDLVTSSFSVAATNVQFGNGDGTFGGSITLTPTSSTQTMTVLDADGDGDIDILTADRFGVQPLSLFLNAGNGTFASRVTIATGIGGPIALTSSDFNHDGYQDVAVANFAQGTVSVLVANGDGTFRQSATLASGAGPRGVSSGDLNGDGYADIFSVDRTGNWMFVSLANGDGTFHAATSYATAGVPTDITAADFNGDGVPDLVTVDRGSNSLGIRIAPTVRSAATPHVSLLDPNSARSALMTFDATLSRITSEIGVVGSSQSRLESATHVLEALVVNYAGAEGRIRDCDVAEESGELVRRQILQQTGAAILAQANQEPAMALTLL